MNNIQAFAAFMLLFNALAGTTALVIAGACLLANRTQSANYALAALLFCGANWFAIWFKQLR